jgi:hypothetical protein
MLVQVDGRQRRVGQLEHAIIQAHRIALANDNQISPQHNFRNSELFRQGARAQESTGFVLGNTSKDLVNTLLLFHRTI